MTIQTANKMGPIKRKMTWSPQLHEPSFDEGGNSRSQIEIDSNSATRNDCRGGKRCRYRYTSLDSQRIRVLPQMTTRPVTNLVQRANIGDPAGSYVSIRYELYVLPFLKCTADRKQWWWTTYYWNYLSCSLGVALQQKRRLKITTSQLEIMFTWIAPIFPFSSDVIHFQ